jgi:hypothetical protein
MKQRQKWFEAFETLCGNQIYADNDKDNLLICICNIRLQKLRITLKFVSGIFNKTL